MNTQPVSRLFIACCVAALMGTGIGVCYSINTTLMEAARISLRQPEVRIKVMVDDDHGTICWMTSAGGVFCMPLAWLPGGKAPASATPAAPVEQAREL